VHSRAFGCCPVDFFQRHTLFVLRNRRHSTPEIKIGQLCQNQDINIAKRPFRKGLIAILNQIIYDISHTLPLRFFYS